VARSQHFADSQGKKVKEHNCSNSRYAKSRFDHGHPLRRTVARSQHFADSQEQEGQRA
jgi:hypothetical protein